MNADAHDPGPAAAAPTAAAPTAAVLLIGNELLSGKVEDRNVAILARLLFGLGIMLRRVIVCPDEVPTISEDLRRLADDHDSVFTSGGVGPTHDDVTIEAVAHCFGRPVVRSQRLESLLRAYFADALTDSHLRMADVPEGADLLTVEKVEWPTVRVENVYVLPGLPEVFRAKMPILRHHLRPGVALTSRMVPVACDEGEIAPLLEDLDARYPEVAIGSYPQWGRGPVRVKITFDGPDPARVERAVGELIAGLGDDQRVPEEPEKGAGDDTEESEA
jgi:molybdenum cofactor synthesis domain-containing protein